MCNLGIKEFTFFINLTIMEIIKENMLNVIVNPYAGGNLARKNIKKISKYLKKEKIAYLVYFSEKNTDIEEYASNLFKSGEKEFVLVGGDGTIHKFINAIPDLSKVNIGIIPSGKHNNFAKSTGLEFNPVKAIQNILNEKLEKFDYLTCGKIAICNSISLGFIENVKHALLRDNKTRNINLFDCLKYLKNYQPIQLNFSGSDIKEKNINVQECYICNGNGHGNLPVSPLSNPQDGLTNVICITKKGDKTSLNEYLKIRRGKHIYDEQNKTFWSGEFTFTSSEMPAKAEIDGELYELDNLSIKTIEGGLNIYVE